VVNNNPISSAVALSVHVIEYISGLQVACKGSTRKRNEVHDEIIDRLNTGTAFYYSAEKLQSFHLLPLHKFK
jgi:hypothetical protein